MLKSTTNTPIIDTRKTTPGLRLLEKYAVTVGGGKNHRFGLDDGVLIKDNHIALAGGITEAITMAKKKVGHLHKIEVEISNWAQLREAIEAGADIVLLDNQTPEEAEKLVELSRQLNPNVLLEASGGMDLDRVRLFADADVETDRRNAGFNKSGNYVKTTYLNQEILFIKFIVQCL